MDTSEETKTIKPKNEGVDPVQLIIWGVLLLIYGFYAINQTLNSGIETNLMYILMPNVILTLFGFMIIILGYRNEKKRVKTPIDQ